jgi:hypothetical protein
MDEAFNADRIADQLLPLGGPYHPDAVVATATAMAELVRRLNHATFHGSALPIRVTSTSSWAESDLPRTDWSRPCVSSPPSSTDGPATHESATTAALTRRPPAPAHARNCVNAL